MKFSLMKWMILFFFLFVFSEKVFSAEIRVRLSNALQSTQLRGEGLKITVDGQGVLKEDPLSLLQVERVFVKGSYAWALRINGEDNARIFPGAELQVSGDLLTQGSKRLPQKVQIYSTSVMRHQFDLISELPLERYLEGVLPKEMPASWPIEALKAQAVAARSYALVRKEERQLFPFDVEASVFDQAFEFVPQKSNPSKWERKIKNVVEKTRGEVLFVQGKVLKTYYHADCGGVTELSENVWGGQQGFKGVIKSCEHESSQTWIYRTTLPSLLRKLGPLISESSQFEGLQVASKSPSGRVQEFVFKFITSSFSISSQNLRELLGFNRLKSALFEIEENDGNITFRGRGHGHGVGMCQYGARSMAQKGNTYRKILSFYFPGSALASIKLERVAP